MSVMIAIAALSLQPQSPPASAQSAPASQTQVEVTSAARDWLALVDAFRWDESWRATGEQMRVLNTAQRWAEVSEQVRVPLGAVVSRVDLSHDSVPSPGDYHLVKFRTSFANRPNTIETLTLAREGQTWRVVGYLIG